MFDINHTLPQSGYSSSLGLDSSLGGVSNQATSPLMQSQLFGVGGLPNGNLTLSQAISGTPTINPQQVQQNSSAAQMNSLFNSIYMYQQMLNASKGSGEVDASGMSQEFKLKVVKIAQELNCSPNDLIKVMKAESGMKSDVVNPNGGATGLIQFMPDTAKNLGTTTAKLKKMSPEEQLDYVEKYLKNAKKSAGMSSDKQLSGGELYALVFMPAKAGEKYLCSAGSKAYSANRALDKNKDGAISVADLEARLAEV